MMEMDGRGSAKYKKSKRNDIIGISEIDLMIIRRNSK